MQPLHFTFSVTNVLESCHSLLTAIGAGSFNKADAAFHKISSLEQRGKRFMEGLDDGQNQTDFGYHGKAVRISNGIICSTCRTDSLGAVIYIFVEHRESRNHSDMRWKNEHARKDVMNGHVCMQLSYF